MALLGISSKALLGRLWRSFDHPQVTLKGAIHSPERETLKTAILLAAFDFYIHILLRHIHELLIFNFPNIFNSSVDRTKIFLNRNFPLGCCSNFFKHRIFISRNSQSRAKRPLNLTFSFNLKTSGVQDVY